MLTLFNTHTHRHTNIRAHKYRNMSSVRILRIYIWNYFAYPLIKKIQSCKEKDVQKCQVKSLSRKLINYLLVHL